MGGEQHRAGIILLLDPLELGTQEVDLDVGNRVPFVIEIGDHAGILERVAEQPDHPHERRIEREIHPGLGHRGPVQRTCFRRDHALGVAEIALERVERVLAVGGAGHDEGIVVARNGEDRRGIVAERFVELVVVVRRLAEIVDDIADVKQESRPVVLGGRVSIDGHLVRDAKFVGIFAGVGSAGIAERMEDDLSGVFDDLLDLRPVAAVGVHQAEHLVGRDP